VVVPCYNSAAFARESVMSVLAQTRAPVEVLVIDDGSTDDIAEVIGSIEDPRVRYHYQANAGVAAARNHGLDLAVGDYVGFLDADDRWRPRALEVLAGVLDAAPSVVCCFADFERFEHATGRVIGTQMRLYPELDAVPTQPLGPPNAFLIQGDPFCQLIRGSDVPAFCSGMLYKRAAIATVRFDPSLRVCEDMAFFLRVVLHGDCAFSREVLCDVRRHPGNLTRDYRRIPVHKVEALRAIAPFVSGRGPRRMLRKRMVRALLDAACIKFAQGDRAGGWAAYREAVRTPGSSIRKIRASPRVLHAWWRTGRDTSWIRA
jgi:glycosyltransferase involved in cell wall biosynthesis